MDCKTIGIVKKKREKFIQFFFTIRRAKRMFPSLSERDKNLLLGGYIFLRYITPAIISPEVYGIVDFKIESAQRRTLVLAAKVLQNMANDQLFQKERYMQPMNNFLTTTKPLLSTFLNNLIDINEPEEYLVYFSFFFSLIDSQTYSIGLLTKYQF